MSAEILHGDCLEVMRAMESASVDAVVTDPPAGISFMGRAWDHDKGGRDHWVSWFTQIMQEASRVLKPGGHAFVWALPRTSHWTALALEDAGFEIRDSVHHIFSSGFPKSHNVSKAIDNVYGAQRDIIGTQKLNGTARGHAARGHAAVMTTAAQPYKIVRTSMDITAPSTDAAKQWDGFGTALKPAHEVWWLCRKPLHEKTVAAQVLVTGTGAINVDACRIDYQSEADKLAATPQGTATSKSSGSLAVEPDAGRILDRGTFEPGEQKGRWPSNVLFSHLPDCTEQACSASCGVAELDRQSGTRTSGTMKAGTQRANLTGYNGAWPAETLTETYGDSGGASRFFPVFRYQGKASRSERDSGLDAIPKITGAKLTGRVEGSAGAVAGVERTSGAANSHPTVKATALMQWLCRLITPPHGVVLDPFAGSGTTGVACIREGFDFIGIEQDNDYCVIARARLDHALLQPHLLFDDVTITGTNEGGPDE